MRLFTFIPRAALIFLLTYMVTVGATYNGILTPSLRLQAMIMLGIGAAVWLIARWRKRGSQWHRTPLDLAIVVWIAAFVLSLLANAETWRRIVMGLWFMGVYIIVWYALHDVLANRIITRAMLVDALLFAGLIVILLGYLQVQGWVRDTLPLIASGELPFSLPRPVSTLGNPNTLAAVLVILIPLAIGRAVSSQSIPRFIMALYTIAALVLLISTFSRGGWVGSTAGLLVLALWLLNERSLLSPARWREWLAAQKTALRLGVLVGSLVAILALIGGTIFFVGSFSVGGRTLDLRTFIYDTALTMFAEKPLTGHGLFTFGGGLARLNSTPPTEPHSHAHSIPLQVAAELGVIGLAALMLTLWGIYRGIQQNSLSTPHPLSPSPTPAAHRAERLTLISASAAFVSFGVHHLLDLPAMNPAVMAMALVALVIAVAPIKPQSIGSSPSDASENARAHRRAPLRGITLFPQPVVTILAILAIVLLLVTGIWSTLFYSQYVDALSYAVGTGDYTGGAARLEPVIAADPSFAVYHQQRGFLLGLAAAAGDSGVLPDAIAEFEQYTALAPEYAIGWANLGALYAQAGDYEDASATMRRAVELAPDAASLVARLSEYESALAAGQPPETVLPVASPISTEADDLYLPNINYVQWLRLAIPRQFLPQVGYENQEEESS